MYPLISLYFGNTNIIINADMYRELVLFVVKHITENGAATMNIKLEEFKHIRKIYMSRV